MNVIEYLREKSVKNLFMMSTFNKSFPMWASEINKELGEEPDFFKILGIGDSLGRIFKMTGTSERSQASVSGGGASWEGLVCWYLNLCLIGSRTVVIKQNKNLTPPCISDAITVNYSNFTSNTEADLIAITFPNKAEFLENVDDSKNSKESFDMIDSLCKQYFDKLQIGIIQCKTNWNDNAQIPMLWDIVYSSTGFKNKHITIGKNGFSMIDFDSFFYAFVTVPSNKGKYKTNSVAVKRVYNLSGGNYWGKASQSGVANSLKEIFNRHFPDSWVLKTQKEDVKSCLENKLNLAYFNLSW